jgi:hypothetical protein
MAENKVVEKEKEAAVVRQDFLFLILLLIALYLAKWEAGHWKH